MVKRMKEKKNEQKVEQFYNDRKPHASCDSTKNLTEAARL